MAIRLDFGHGKTKIPQIKVWQGVSYGVVEQDIVGFDVQVHEFFSVQIRDC